MSEPLTREERDATIRYVGRFGCLPMSAKETVDRYEATVQDGDERAGALRRELDAAWLVIDYAMYLVINGERAPGGDETWGQWEEMVRALDDAKRGAA